METASKKLYIVGFGDSRKYLYTCENVPGRDAMHHMTPFVELEKELNAYLKTRFPGETFAYYTSVRATEVDPAHMEKYEKEYPPLDAAAVENIKKELVREIEDEDATKMLNDNAPFADAPV